MSQWSDIRAAGMPRNGRLQAVRAVFACVAVLFLAAPMGAFAAFSDSPSFVLDTRIPGSTASGDSTTFAFDTRGNVGMNDVVASTFFVVDTRDLTLSVPVVLSGRITDANGFGLAGVTVSAAVGMTIVAQVTTDANGYYQLPPLSSVAYALIVAAPGYASTARVLTLSADAATQNFQLTTLPGAPTLQPTTRTPPTLPSFGPMGSTLKVFDGAAFVPITTGNMPSPDRMTIVLTHGWLSNPAAWAQAMAAQMRDSGVTANMANIVAWDWPTASAGTLPPSERTPSQGVALGQALQAVLGTGYSQKVHFLGHSLGALVNGAAANYLHGDPIGQQKGSPTPWSNAPMHLTLFDDAELSPALGVFDGIAVSQLQLGVSLPSSGTSLLSWTSPIPKHFSWVDNYVSLVGLYHSEAVNVILWAGQNHSYAYQWYKMTVANPAGCVLGFQRSYEAEQAGLSAFSFPPSRSDFPLGVTYEQSTASGETFTLTVKPTFSQLLGSLANAVVGAIQGTVQAAGNVVATVESGALQARQMISEGFDYVSSIAAQGGQVLVNLYDSGVLRLYLSTAATSGQQMQGKLVQTLDVGGGSTNGPAMAWIPIQFPSNAVAMAFDFIMSGDPVDDVLVCGIETNNLFALEAKYIPTNTVSASSLIDVSAWAGTTNELFFGLMGSTSSNATLQIDNIRFYSLQSNLVDSVGDGIPDTWRAQYFPGVDPTGMTTNYLSCAACDADGTGQNNLFKYLAGLDPTNSASIFRILSVEPQGNNLAITWQTVGGKTNVVTASSDLTGSYTNVSPNIAVTGSGDTTTNYVDQGGATNKSSRFYRIRLVP